MKQWTTNGKLKTLVEMTMKGYNANNDPQKPVSVRSSLTAFEKQEQHKNHKYETNLQND